MGAWGAGSFENDTALDFLLEFEASPGWSVVSERIARVNAVGLDYLEAPEAAEAVAAAELIAAGLGRPSRDMPPDTAALIAAMVAPPEGLASSARRAIVHVMDHSELAQLWSQDEARGIGQTSPDWLEAMEDLLTRLAS